MCFSAGASFTAAGLTGIAGLAAMIRAPTNGQRVVAGIPLFFAAHQLAEGVLWLALAGSVAPVLARPAMFAFLSVAEIVWPSWVPLAVRGIEVDAARRRGLTVLLVLGIALALVNVYGLLVFPADALIMGQHIQYRLVTPPVFRWTTDLTYALVTILPLFVSSSRLIRIMGTLVLGSLILSKVIFYETFISVWCFFAALISAMVVVVVFQRASHRLPATSVGAG